MRETQVHPEITLTRCALRATEAGEYLAFLVGRLEPFTAQQMWAMARADVIPVVRVGRRIFWQSDTLTSFVSTGGSRRWQR